MCLTTASARWLDRKLESLIGNWKFSPAPHGQHAGRATGAMAEPGRKTRGKARSARTFAGAAGCVKRNQAESGQGGRRDGADQPFGPGYPSIGSGMGRSSKKGS